MCVCVYVCMYVCVYVCMYVCTYVCMRVHMPHGVYLYVCVCIYNYCGDVIRYFAKRNLQSFITGSQTLHKQFMNIRLHNICEQVMECSQTVHKSL